MSKDDFDVVVCKLLSYLMACMKAGIEPSVSKAKEVTGCNDLYWQAVLEDLYELGYIRYHAIPVCGNPLFRVDDLRITMQGSLFLKDNSSMSNVRSTLGSLLPEIVEVAVKATSLI